MGTNYYMRSQICSCCGSFKEEKHIGKQSIGWEFLFSGEYPELTQSSQWHEILSMDGVGIYDEYGKKIEFEDFWNKAYKTLHDNKLMNHTRIIKRIPETVREKEYLKKMGSDYFSNKKNKEYWIDSKGFSFQEACFY